MQSNSCRSLGLLLLVAACTESLSTPSDVPASTEDRGMSDGPWAIDVRRPTDADTTMADVLTDTVSASLDAGAMVVDVATDTATAPPVDRSVVTYAGAARFRCTHVLSDGTVLVGGSAPSLDWVPRDVARVEVAATGIDAASVGNVAFLMHIDRDLRRVLRVVHLPRDTVRDIVRIRSNERPGDATGALFVSGTRDTADRTREGYFIARLDANFVTRAPTAFAWTFNVRAPPRRGAGATGGDSSYRTIQPWDVTADGKVIYGGGTEYDYDWAFLARLGADGRPDVVPAWRFHSLAGGGEFNGPASAYRGSAAIIESGIPLKVGRRGSLRSETMADYMALLSDGNGRTDRQGRWPDDYYFSGPCPFDMSRCAASPGYTGYRVSDRPTQRLGAVAVDRRSGRFYFGYSTQSVLPSGEPDFEPAVVAMEPDGSLLWWSRLYTETRANSPPDQYVDGLAIDASNDTLVVLARTHGNAVDNFWSGDRIAATPGARGFQNRFTGSNGNIHVSWLGRLRLENGTLTRATYEAQYIDGNTRFGSALTDPNLAPWPDPNGGWPDVNTTRCNDVAVDRGGRVYVTCAGRRTITTNDAVQRMTLPGMGPSTWNRYVRVYSADLASVRYSTLLVGRWDPTNGAGGDNTEVMSIAPTTNGVVAVGWHVVNAMGVATGNPVPTIDVPAWGRAMPSGASALFAHYAIR
jgi:hypothetical protein